MARRGRRPRRASAARGGARRGAARGSGKRRAAHRGPPPAGRGGGRGRPASPRGHARVCAEAAAAGGGRLAGQRRGDRPPLETAAAAAAPAGVWGGGAAARSRVCAPSAARVPAAPRAMDRRRWEAWLQTPPVTPTRLQNAHRLSAVVLAHRMGGTSRKTAERYIPWERTHRSRGRPSFFFLLVLGFFLCSSPMAFPIHPECGRGPEKGGGAAGALEKRTTFSGQRRRKGLREEARAAKPLGLANRVAFRDESADGVGHPRSRGASGPENLRGRARP